MPGSNHPFDILGISPGASDEEIERVYKALIYHWHPDRNSEPEAAERARQLTWAHAELRDPDRRRHHELTYGKARATPGDASVPGAASALDDIPPWTTPPGKYRRSTSTRRGASYVDSVYSSGTTARTSPRSTRSRGSRATTTGSIDPTSPVTRHPTSAPNSADGMYRWDGKRWLPAHHVTPDGLYWWNGRLWLETANLSPNGSKWWNGRRWIVAVRLSPDGNYFWNGRQWFPTEQLSDDGFLRWNGHRWVSLSAASNSSRRPQSMRFSWRVILALLLSGNRR